MFRSVQVLRGVAACSVLMLHVSQSARFAHKFDLGAAGVDLFFVISGFIMAQVTAAGGGRTPGQFLFDRFWRIYPLWLIAVTPWIFWTNPAWSRLMASLTLWPVYGSWVIPALRVGWTLSFEMLFYFALAASMRVGAKPVLALFAIMLSGAATLGWPIFNYFGNPMIFEFLFGVAIAHSPKLPKVAPPLLLFALFALWLAPTWVGDGELTWRIASAWRVLYWGMPAALIVYACVSAEAVFASGYWLPALVIGDASYSLYLFHPAVIELPVPWPIKFMLAVAAGVTVWWFIERRLLALKRAVPLAAGQRVSL